MKVVADTSPPAQTGGILLTHEMGISSDAEDQAMILNTLSNALYTDKVGAVLREYGCNAADANVEAGRGDIPIEVRLPNKLDASCSIRDFGFGMTEEQVALTFCRLGRSTKRSSNAFTGMLGIGSKAGFAYGDSFLVTSYVSGQKTVYNCYRDQGRLLMARMLQAPSDSPDGVEVKVPVRQADVAEFTTRAERIFRYFKVRPKIIGQKIDFESNTPEFTGTGWRYIGDSSTQSVAVMGNVGYDISFASMGTGLAARHSALLQLGIELDFTIGDLEIAANREGLQYKDITRRAITAALDVVSTEISRIFTDKIASAPSLWDARRLYADNFEKLGTYARRSLKEVVDGKIVWKGQSITTGRVPVPITEAELAGGVHVSGISRRSYGRRSLQTLPNPEWIYASTKTVLCINDLPKRTLPSLRVKGFFNAHPNAETFCVFSFPDAATQASWWKKVELDGAPTILFSSVVPVAPSPRLGGGSAGPSAHRSKHSANAFSLDETQAQSYGVAKSQFWTVTPVDYQDDEGVYVVIDKFRVRHPDRIGWDDPVHFKPQVFAMRKAGLIKGPVFGFRLDKVGKLGKGWVKLEDSVRAALAKIAAASAQALSNYLDAHAHLPLLPVGSQKKFPSGSAMHKYLNVINTASTGISKDMIEMLHTDSCQPWIQRPPLPKTTLTLTAMKDKTLETYPLLELVSAPMLRIAGEKSLTAIAAYVTLVAK